MDLQMRFVRYGVTSFNECLVHYRDVLGLPLKFTDHSTWAEFKTGDVRFAIERIDDADGKTYRGACFQTPDLEGFWDSLAGAGVGVGALRDGAHERYGIIVDPDGNEVVVYAPKL
ncbi:VOC family protein [Paenarthrobacter sp. NPDC058040]|uniref:VOC family protein n=1 Tax=unclassified Paenarthrobacter TaxID=2634190 RepID=UPI0036DBDD19